MSNNMLEFARYSTDTLTKINTKELLKFLEYVVKNENTVKIELNEAVFVFTEIILEKTKDELKEEIEHLKMEKLKLEIELVIREVKRSTHPNTFMPTPFMPTPIEPYKYEYTPEFRYTLNTNPITTSELTGKKNGL